ncbi:hypothetical protein KIPB_003332 [Kipferlia bialata]|uniref:Uncharacterized protein n=1 Tax=Kipferlia bialata TaxID=797122 RepID=A0A391NK05_9EUKA|nr:hypothetical protein KIPB_003332 [Kipferlia bialata]|eukprot:g3332.t1
MLCASIPSIIPAMADNDTNDADGEGNCVLETPSVGGAVTDSVREFDIEELYHPVTRPPVHLEDLVPVNRMAPCSVDLYSIMLPADQRQSHARGYHGAALGPARDKARYTVTQLIGGALSPQCDAHGWDFQEILDAALSVKDAHLDHFHLRPTEAQERLLREVEQTVGLDAIDLVWMVMRRGCCIPDTCDLHSLDLVTTHHIFADPYSTLNKLVRMCRDAEGPPRDEFE